MLLHIAKYQETPLVTDFCEEGPVHRAIHSVMIFIEDHAKRIDMPLRFAATKAIEGDKLVLESLQLDVNERKTIEHIVKQMEDESGLDRAAAIADMRYSFIMNVVDECVQKPHVSKERERSAKIDKILTGKYTAIPSFIIIMGLVFYLTFNVIGLYLQGLLEQGIDLLTQYVDTLLTTLNVNNVIHSLVIDAIFGGVGTVLSFLPIIVTLFFFLSLLEDTGYMARIAFVMDKLLRKIGLSGRSIVPLLIGFGCSVPGVMSSRTLPSSRDRIMTVLLIPFMSCTAKLPIYAFFTNTFFPEYAGIIMIFLYFLGIVVGIITAVILKNTYFTGEAVPFVMELPNYRMPGAKNVLQLLWEKSKDFIQKAFTVIFVATIVVWFLQTFNFRLNVVSDSSQSMIATISTFVAPIFKFHGFNDWRVVSSLISGFLAKESVVSTLQLLFKGSLATSISAVSAFGLLVFCLLYTPCVAAIASVKRELGGKWATVIVVLQCTIAWIVSLIVVLIGSVL